MTTATRKSISSQTREELEEINENESNKQSTININNNTIAPESTKVHQDTTSRTSPKHQRATNTTLRNEYKYSGDIYAEKKHGTGVLSWSDNRTYTGAFYADKRHGFGAFQNSDLSEFKGLYRHDERYGPGVLIYQSSQCADVGFWLGEDLVRLLYPHPTLNLNIHITDKKSRMDSSFILPSWYSPYELLPTIIDFDFILNKKPNALLCKSIKDDNSFFTRYLIDHSDRVQQVMHDKRAQLDAYLTCLNDEHISTEKFFNERIADISTSNETYEQQQLYYHTNKFLPLKQQATFPIDEILSNNRSVFPEPGPLENSSLTLLELAFNGQTKRIRDLLMHRQTYVDVCDSRGLTALHFATHNIYIDVVNVLLDFGANVNQLTDDGLTPLAIAFLFYYGNDPQETINTALEHTDPVISNLKSTSTPETRRSSSKDKIAQENRVISRTNTADEDKLISSIRINNIENRNSYGYQLTDDLRERIRDEQFRESVHTLIKLLLRRGADPSLSDWPLPVLALAVRAGDKEMVELLLRKKAQVNCRLSPNRHANLTPLHIACGSLAPNAIDIVRLLLEHGAQVNAESSPVENEYFSLADPSVRDTNNKINDDGRTPLHIVCAREATEDTLPLVRLLLEYQANPNVVCNGQTPLSLAISMGHESSVDLLIDQERTDPSISLGEGNGNALCTVLSTASESRWTCDKRVELIERIIKKNPKVLYPVRFGPKNTLGSSIDYGYYSFFADTRISQTPYHVLSPEERITYKERKEILAHVAKRFREEVTKHEDLLDLPTSEIPSGSKSSQRTGPHSRSITTEKTGDMNLKTNNDFHFCATCGRSTGVRLTACKQCEKVFFCSKACKLTGLDAFHRDECQPIERPTSPTKTTLNDKLPNRRLKTHQTKLLPLRNVGTSQKRVKNLTDSEDALFKNSLSSIKISQQPTNSSQLPKLSAAQLIRQKRLKKMGRLNGGLEGTNLSWNYTYDAPENYSFI